MLPIIRSDLSELAAYQAEVIEDFQDVTYDKLDANEVALDLPEDLKSKLGGIAQTHILANRYPDGEYSHLKQLLADYVGHGITADGISLGNGSDELIRSLLIVSCLHRGSILVAKPTFSMYGILAQSLGVPTVEISRTADFTIDVEIANQALANNNIAAVFLVHPNSPTGNLLTAQELNWVRSLPENILVVIDEAYFEFSGVTVAAELAQHPNWVILRTFSKAFRLAAYRVGYAIACPEFITALEKVRLPYNLPAISYLAAELAVTNRHELLANIPEIISERDRLAQELQRLGVKLWRSDANFLFAQTDDDRAVIQALKKQGTLIRQTGGGLRITIGTPEQNQRTLDRLKVILA